MPARTPDDVRVAVDRALARLPPDVAAEAPRPLAVALALADDLSAEEALARCGVTVPAHAGAPPTAAFVLVPPGSIFRWRGAAYRKVTARVSRALVPGAPNAFAVETGEGAYFLPTQRVERVPLGRRAA